jgi:hypothetical protein
MSNVVLLQLRPHVCRDGVMVGLPSKRHYARAAAAATQLCSKMHYGVLDSAAQPASLTRHP